MKGNIRQQQSKQVREGGGSLTNDLLSYEAKSVSSLPIDHQVRYDY
jgi:hypothetical protein